MGRIGVLVTWSELTGTWPSKAMLQERLAAYALQPVLLGLARLSARLVTWQHQQNTRGDFEAVREMLPRHFPAIERLVAANPNRVVLTRITILYVAKQALGTCEPKGKEIDTPWDAEQIMTCCLMANDLLLGRIPRPTDTTIEKAASLLPFSNYVPAVDDPLDIARNLILINEIAPKLTARRDYRNLAAEFTESTGFTPQTFCEFVFCAATKFITNLKEQNNDAGLVLTPDHFQHTCVKDGLAEFLRQYSMPLADLQADFLRTTTPDDDFTIFQNRPLIEFVPHCHMCIDPGFLLDKAGRSFYWTLHDNTPIDQQKHLLGYWATLVEAYVQWMAGETYKGRGSLISDPRFANGDQACDIAIREGSVLILIEIKASILTARAKYSFDPEILKTELLRKAIQGDEGERKGIAQLHRAVQRFQSGDNITGVREEQISRIFPMMVFLDKSFTSPHLSAVYRDYFDRTTLRKKPKVASPLAVTVGDLESVLPFTLEHQLSDILDEHYRWNRTSQGSPAFGGLARADIPLLKNAKRGRDLVRERFSQFNDDLIANVFPPGQ